MPKFGKYDSNSVPNDADIFIAKRGSETVTYTLGDIKDAANDVSITDYPTGQTFDATDMNGIYRFTAAAANTLPEITTAMLGKFIEIRKRTTGNVSIAIAGSDVIKNDSGDDTSLANNDATQTWAGIRLRAEALTVWGIEFALGDWI